jgi:hypothetical protein
VEHQYFRELSNLQKFLTRSNTKASRRNGGAFQAKKTVFNIVDGADEVHERKDLQGGFCMFE